MSHPAPSPDQHDQDQRHHRDPHQRPRHDGRRLVLDAGLGAGVVLAALSGLVARFFLVDFTFEPGSTTHEDYVSGGVALLTTAALLAVALPVLAHFRAAPWTYLVTGVAFLLELGLGVDCLVRAGSAPRSDFGADYSVGQSALVIGWLPTSWPLLLFVLVAFLRLLTTQSSPGPRAPRDR